MLRPSREALQRLLRPKSIAVVGGREAAIVAEQCDHLGYEGTIWPVNARRDSIAGRPCLKRLENLPESPDAVFIAIPAEPTIEAVGILADTDAGGIVCFASGFR